MTEEINMEETVRLAQKAAFEEDVNDFYERLEKLEKESKILKTDLRKFAMKAAGVGFGVGLLVGIGVTRLFSRNDDEYEVYEEDFDVVDVDEF